MEGVAVEVGVDGDGPDAELAEGADDAHRDLAPVGNQHLGEHTVCLLAVPGDLAKRALAGTRFVDVRWVESTGSTNADLIRLARDGAPEGIVLVADHQTAGRGRQGRSWTAPPGASLLLSILLRPTAATAQTTTMAVAVAAAEAVHELAGFQPRLKWPNDLVWPGDGSSPDRKLAGVLAEADWSGRPGSGEPRGGDVAVVVGLGINVSWPDELPPDLADVAIAINHIEDVSVDREQLLIAVLRRLDRWLYAPGLLDRWRELSATLGRRVRILLAAGNLTGTALDIDESGHLVIEMPNGERRTVAVGDVVHLRTQ
jgi:BirA family biotin operon repressor/biotin-[acetyl-CoA-carboxylase] ligase